MSDTVAHKKHTGSRYSLTANMFLAFIVTFAAGTMCFEEYMPESFTKIYIAAVIAICFITWFVLSFISGKKKKWQFAVFSFLFWILPQVIIYLSNDGPEVFRKSITRYLLSEFSLILASAPAEAVGGLINVKVIPFTFIIIMLCIFSFLGGYLMTNKEDKK